MTHQAFISRQIEAQIQIQCLCIPWGRIYAVWMAALFGIPFSLGCLFWSFYSHAGFMAYLVFSGELVACLLLGAGANWFYKRNAQHYRRWNVECPFCHRSLVFLRKWEAKEIAEGHCPHCQKAMFDA